MSFSVWKNVKIKDVAETIFSGGTPSTKKEEFWNGKINWLSSGETRNKFIVDTEKKITQEGVDNSSTKLAKKKDVVIASAGQGFTRGQTSMCLIDTYINQSLICVRAKKDIIDPYYLFYNISSRYNELRQISDGHSIRGSLTTKLISDLNISLPTIDEQRKIREILFSIDNKIETNNEINKKLEEMAQAIFKQWFVDFEFPNEDGKPYKSSGGEMVESELGMIPKGWEVKKLSEVISVKDGTHDSPKAKEDGFSLITSKHIKGNKILYNEAKLISKEDFDKINKRSKVDTNDILITMIGTVGNLIIVNKENVDFAIKNIGLIKTSENEEIFEFVYLYLKSKEMKNYIESRLAGSTQQYISLNELRNIPIILPKKEILTKFKKIIKSIFEQITIDIREESNLIHLRDTLLPKLMSGEIRVPID